MSKFWTLLAERHQEVIAKEGLDDFRKHLSPEYSASEIYDNKNWLASAYRRCKEMGVTFIDAQTSSDKAPTPPLDLSQRVAQLEMEVAKLHRTIVELKSEFRKQRDD